MPEFLTRKLGPLPVWGWLVIAGVAVYVIRKRQAASSAAQQSSSQQPASLYPTDVGAPAYYGSGAGGGGGGATPPAGTYTYQPPGTDTTGGGSTKPPPGTITTPTPPTVPPPGVPTTSPTPGSGGGVNAGCVGVTDPNLAGAYQRSGGTLYYQPASGVYAPVTAQSNLPKGTGLYIKK
jgi:hypothetical protein